MLDQLAPQQPTASAEWAGKTVLVVSPTPTHPQDYGNRKRIYRVCKMLQDAGAKIHFIHYASEAEWRDAIPEQAQTAMMREWDGYYLVTPSRWLHTAPSNGEHHDKDDWWDPQLEPMIGWLTKKLMVDAVIVNYTWLTKAFEFVPNHVLKVLDTHDKFSNRKELLLSQGLKPEFFYLTEQSEKEAFARADMLWAIKSEEEAIFRTMTDKPVTTVPHADLFEPIRAAGALSNRADADELVFGIIGAKNNINTLNTTRFLEAAKPIFKEHLAPLKIVIAGTVCELLDHIDLPFVEKIGWVDDSREFYERIDVALIPMEFSTGLKIKTAEALSFGMPIVSHAHAFEGYKPHHPYHRLGSFQEIAEACVDLACEPERLESLRTATVATYGAVVEQMEDGVAKTGAMLRGERDKTLICVSKEAVAKGSIAQAAFRGYREYLSYRGPIALFVQDADKPSDLLRFCMANRGVRIFVDEAYRDRIQPAQAQQIAEAGARFITLPALRKEIGVRFLWLDATPADLGCFAGESIERIYVNAAQMSPADQAALAAVDLNAATDAFTRVTVLAADDTPFVSSLREAYGAEMVHMPPYWEKKFDPMHELVSWEPAGRYGVTLVLPRRSPAIERVVARAMKAGGDRLLTVVVEEGAEAGVEYRDDVEYRIMPLAEAESPRREHLRNARLTVAFTPRGGPSERLLETLYAARHPVLRPVEPERHGRSASALQTPRRLWSLMCAIAAHVGGEIAPHPDALDRGSAGRNDAGWTRIWAHAT